MKNLNVVWAALTALTLLGGGARASDSSDAWITTKVSGSLLSHKDVSITHTKVHTAGGVVTLKGTARSQAERELAASYASEVQGVKEVRNQIDVAQSEKADDATITGRVRTALEANSVTNAMNAGVGTKDGVVTLSGKARTNAEKTLAERVVKKVGGVKAVQNDIEVK
jgi:hyperosmotically inducible protein